MGLRVIAVFMAIMAIFAIFVSGAGIIATAEKEDNTVQAGGEAIFTITVVNTQIREGTFKLEVDDFDLVPFSQVVERVTFDPSSTVTIGANQEKEIIARVKFLDSVTTDKNYVTVVRIKSTTNNAVSTTVGLSSYVISPREVVEIDLDIPEIIIPGREEILKVKIKNNANINLQNLDIFYTSSVFNYEDKVGLAPLGEEEVDLSFNLDSLTEQGEYTLTIRIFDDGKIKGSNNFKFNVGLNPDLREVDECRRGFLTTECEIVRENEGNTEVSKTVKFPVGYIQSLFTESYPEGEVVIKNGERIFQWVFTIPPGDIYRIEIVTNYRLPFFVIVGVLVIIGVFFYFRRKDLKISKTIFKVHELKESGITELKVLLHIKNRTHKEMYNVKVIDLFPRIVKPDMEFGTLKPNKIQEGSRGMRLIWELDKFDPGDEIVITYKIKTKLSLIGKLELPGAVAQYYGRNKRIVNVKSNKLVYRG